MNSHKTTVIPFPAPSKNGSRYNAETEKQNNVIGTRLSEELSTVLLLHLLYISVP